MTRLYYGIGVDDTGLTNARYADGKMLWMDSYFSRWKGMIRRCHAPSKNGSDDSYTNTRVCDEWLHLSNFKRWMQSQDWEDRDLDKDFLCTTEAIYSPNTCVFIPKAVNYFLGNSKSRKGEWPLGVSFDRNRNKFASHIRVNGKSVGLGRYTTPQAAHKAYQKAKIDAALTLIDNHAHDVDKRVINSLSVIIQKIQDDLQNDVETHSILPIDLPERYKTQILGELPA